jgi:hypothetical protein
MRKQVQDLEELDLRQHCVWYFDNSSLDSDEMTVSSVRPSEAGDADVHAIVRCSFLPSDGRGLVGYVYHYGTQDEELVQVRKPFVWIGDDCFGFWYGIRDPRLDRSASRAFEVLSERGWPIRYVSDVAVGGRALEGTLDGLYWISDRGVCCVNGR